MNGRSVRVPAEFLKSPQTELMVCFMDSELGVIESAIALTDVPVEKPSPDSLMQSAYGVGEDDPATAAKRFREAVEYYPENADILNAAAWFLVTTKAKELRDPRQAIIWSRKAVELTDEKDGNILDTLAVALYEDGKLAEAVPLIQRAAKLSPRDEIIKRAKAYAQELEEK